MTLRQGTIPRAQEREFTHPDVVAIATNVVRGHHFSLVRLAKLAILWSLPASDPRTVLTVVPVPPELAGRAEAIVRAGLRIAAEPDIRTRKRRRGAVVERIVWAALRIRDRNVLREQEIELTRNRWTKRSWSKPKEVVSERPDALEVIECKRDPESLGGLDQDDLDELADIRDTAASDGLTPHVTVAVMEAARSLRVALPGTELSSGCSALGSPRPESRRNA